MEKRWWALITLILLVAAVLRLWGILDVPPGVTHDEADHGLSAWGVVQGIRPLYFTVGYGREPLYDYVTAGLMTFLGPHYITSRLTSIYFSLILIAATFAWTRRAFNREVALLTCAGLAVSFWGIMVGRHALRTITMPALFTLATVLWWRKPQHHTSSFIRHTFLPGLILGATYYTYYPARIMWVLFPAMVLWWLITDRPQAQRMWRPTLLMLLIAGAVASPLFAHIKSTSVEQRIDQLIGPLNEIRNNNNWQPLLKNTVDSLKIFTIHGDDGEIMSRYNIPGRPILTPIMGSLFYGGLLFALIKTLFKRHSSTAIALMWLIGGLVPVFVTGLEGSTTRAIAIMPILYLFPALILAAGRRWLSTKNGRFTPIYTSLIALFFMAQLLINGRAYFVTWANDPAVREQYETTRLSAIEWLNLHGEGAAALSSPNPNRYHDPSLATVALNNQAVQLRWFNGAHSLILPDAEQTDLLFSRAADSTLLNHYFDVKPREILPLNANDVDRPITIYTLNTREMTKNVMAEFVPLDQAAVQLGDYATLLGYDINYQPDPSGLLMQVATMWRVDAIAPTAPLEGVKLKAHLFDQGQPIESNPQDRLDVPSFYWQTGDHFIQWHEIIVPDTVQGDLTLYIGGYRQDGALIESIGMVKDGQLIGNELAIPVRIEN